MNVYINTRGIVNDYRYLGDNQPNLDWLTSYKQYSSFEHPTLIIEQDAIEWRLFLSGIVSERRDKVNTPIRYSFIFTGNTEESKPNALINFISFCLQAFYHTAQMAELASKLNELYDESEIESYFEHLKCNSEKAREAKKLGQAYQNDPEERNRISAILKTDEQVVQWLEDNFPSTEADASSFDNQNMYCGDIKQDRHQQALLRAFDNGEKGLFCYFNYFESADEVEDTDLTKEHGLILINSMNPMPKLEKLAAAKYLKQEKNPNPKRLGGQPPSSHLSPRTQNKKTVLLVGIGILLILMMIIYMINQ